MKSLDVLLVGCGNIAGGFDAARPGTATPFSHAGAYLAHGGFTLRACVEPDDARRLAFQQRWDIEQGYRSLSEAREAHCGIDIISICSPTSSHDADLRLALTMRPRLVFGEKPLTADLASSREIAALYESAEIPLVVNYTRRWDYKLRALAAQLAQGEWGRVRAVSGIYNKGLLNNGSHMLDMLMFLFGPLHVLGSGAPIIDMWDYDPSIPASLVSVDGGIPIALNCADARDYALFELQIVTEEGVLAMENGGLDWQIRRVKPSPMFVGYRSLGARVQEAGSLDKATLAAVTEIHVAVVDGGPLSCTSTNAIAVQQLCEVIHAQSRHTFSL